MQYTTPLTFKELKTKLERLCGELCLTLEITKTSASDGCDGKVSTRFYIKTNTAYIEFYDYKMTKLYSNVCQSVTAFRKTQYEWHVQGNEPLITEMILNKLKYMP